MRARTLGWRRRHPWRFAAVFALIAMTYFAALPIWDVWHVCEWCAQGKMGTSWQSIESFMTLVDREGLESALRWHEADFVRGPIIFAALLAVGRWIGGRELRWMERLSDPMDDPRPL